MTGTTASAISSAGVILSFDRRQTSKFDGDNMPYQLTGILKLPDGTPAANVDIEFVSQANYSPLVRDLSNTIRTSATGSYSVALEYGEYAIRLLYASAYPLHPGKIYVYADTPAGQDLSTLLQAGGDTSTAPNYIVQIQNWLVEAKAAHDGAMESAAEARASELAAKASEIAVEADRAEVATNKTAVSASQADVTTKQADVAAKAAQVASDKEAAEAAKVAAVAASDTASQKAVLAAESSALAQDAATRAEQSAQALVGALIDAGSYNAASGVLPAPVSVAGSERSCVWKVIGSGVAGGIELGVGDSLVYTTSDSSYYKIDNTESVTSINGKKGVVSITASDVGADPSGTSSSAITQHEAKAGAHSISGVAGLQTALDAKLNATATAAAATKLATARTIGGVSFDGSANINLPGVNAGGNQSTSGNAATATKLATARTLTIGDTGKTFDGSANQSWSLGEIGALSSTDNAIWKVRGYQSDLNAASSVRPGYFSFAPGTTGSPDSTIYGHGFSIGPGGDAGVDVWASQVVFGHNSKIYTRNAINAAPTGSWNRIYTTADNPTASDVGALASTGGTLTGALTGTSAVLSSYLSVGGLFTANSSVRAQPANAGWMILSGNPGGWGELVGKAKTDADYQWESGLRWNTDSTWSVGAVFRPTTDNVRSLGTSAFRWSTVYAGTGTINTSDAREKTAVTPLNEAEIAAAKVIGREIGTYQWLESINQKGDSARHHVGLTVQRAIEIMEAHGLEPFRYGFICYDAWEAEYQDVDDEAGDLVRTVERQVTRAEERTTTEIKIVDGVPTQVTTVTTEQIPVYEDKAVVDEAGNPVLVNHPAEFDEDGGIIREAYSTALTHPVPVMESVEVRYRRDVVREAGDRYSFRMDQLALFCLCGIAQSS